MNRHRRWWLIGLIAGVALSVVAAAVVALTALRPGTGGLHTRDSWSGDVQYADESQREVIALTATYSLANDKVVAFPLGPPASGRVPVAWKVSATTGEVTARILQGDEPARSLILQGEGCEVVSLQPDAPSSLEIRVTAPADGRLELAWREVKDCG